jgi:hypothetical protein
LKELNNICLYCLLLNNYKESIKYNINICKNKDLIIFLNEYSLNNIYYIIQEYIINNSLLKLGSVCYTYLFPPRICAKLKEKANSIKCLYPSLILNIISILLIRVKNSKGEAFYNNPIIKDKLLNYSPFEDL